MEFNEKLQQLRKQKNWTQEELAELLYVSRTAISKWESGRGYPNIESLKAISKLFAVSIDDLLSGAELITLAETENQKNVRGLRGMVFGILDCMTALLFIIPMFGQQGEDMIYAVSLFALTDIPDIMRVVYFVLVLVTIVFGITELALQNFQHHLWIKNKAGFSLLLSISGTVWFIISRQPYAAVFIFLLLVIKGSLLIKT